LGRYQEQYGLISIMRVLSNGIVNLLGEDKGKNRYGFKLFPQGFRTSRLRLRSFA
jgi:sulfur relay (sulfurtransferase) DsrC/TusE family protein